VSACVSHRWSLLAAVSFLSVWLAPCGRMARAESAYDEFKVKREQVFEFVQKPTIVRSGDHVTIRFETKALCDVTVAVEDETGTIVRHLASGVLGDNAPDPFRKNAKAQAIVWDGKDDAGVYIDDTDRIAVRVSLGLEPRFERNLFWSPKKRTHQAAPCMQAAPEGVYVYDGRVFDAVRLFDHDGAYVRTVYPFPAKTLKEVRGLHWRTFPQTGARLPVKQGFHQSTLLSSGTNAGIDADLGVGVDAHNNWHGAVWGNAASAMAVRDGRIALARLRLNRLVTDPERIGGGLALSGPAVSFPMRRKGRPRSQPEAVPPRSAAFSPDGRWLYLTAYPFGDRSRASRDIILINYYDWLPGLVRLDFRTGTQAEVLVGGMRREDKGSGTRQFAAPSSVDVDAAGRVYVSDYANDRVQVFSPDGAHLKTIPTKRPGQVSINEKTQEIYVFSWFLPNENATRNTGKAHVEPTLTVFKSFEDPTPTLTCPLPMRGVPSRGTGLSFRAELDPWADPVTIWFATDWGRLDIMTRGRMTYSNITIHALHEGRLRLKRDFSRDVRRAVKRIQAPEYFRQRLYVNPKTGALYIGEGQAAAGKSFKELVRVDPETGRIDLVAIPFDAEDMAFDADGLAYLRTFYYVARYNPETWTEAPFDYGQARQKVTTSSSSGRREAFVTSAIRLPVAVAGLHHHGGMTVSVNGNLAIAVNNYTQKYTRKDIYDKPLAHITDPYTPTLFPGRVRWGEIHVYDRFGRVLFGDAIPGLNRLDGLGLDKDNNLYVMTTATRILDGKRYVNGRTETLVKFDPARAKVVSASERASVPLPEGTAPKRPPDFANGHVGRAWALGAAWCYGGVGFGGKNGGGRASGGCDCYNARFALDYFGRSFAPETEHYSVAVLDTAGNLILRIGRYGNVDDGVPLVGATGGSSARSPSPPRGEGRGEGSGVSQPSPLPGRERERSLPRSIGGDEVALCHPAYLATHTDRRLFIADPGNARILSVKLDYHTTERVALKDVKDGG